jgi:hypothetical protein
MADQIANRTPNRLGMPEQVLLPEVVGPLGVNTPDPNGTTGITLYAGALLGYNTVGKIDNIDSTTSTIVSVAGVCGAYFSSVATAGFNFTSPDGVKVLKGPYSFLNDGSITGTTPYGTDLFAVDNQTLSTVRVSATGTPRIRAGFFECLDPSNTANVICNVGQASPLAMASAAVYASTPFYARAVVTSIDAFGGTGTDVLTETTPASGLGTQDGVTLVVGDVVFIQAGTANVANAKDSGPWVVTTLGGASVSWVLTRPDWWTQGMAIPQAKVLDVGGEGTKFAGLAWKTFCGKSKVVGTDDPAFYIGRFVDQVAFVSGDNGAHTYAPPVGVRSAAHSFVGVMVEAVSGTNTGVTSIAPLAITTPGYTATASMTLTALGTALAAQSVATTATVQVLIVNW